MAEPPQSVDAKIGLQPAAAIADVLNLEAILSTPQLTAPDVEQVPVKPKLHAYRRPQKAKKFCAVAYRYTYRY